MRGPGGVAGGRESVQAMAAVQKTQGEGQQLIAQLAGAVAGVIAKAESLDAQNARLFAAVQNLAGRANRGAIQQHKAQ